MTAILFISNRERYWNAAIADRRPDLVREEPTRWRT
jgi:hypothetical protein